MREFLTNYFFPGPALSLLGILLAVAGYMNFEGLAASSVELGLSRLAMPAVVHVLAVLFGAAGFACTISRDN